MRAGVAADTHAGAPSVACLRFISIRPKVLNLTVGITPTGSQTGHCYLRPGRPDASAYRFARSQAVITFASPGPGEQFGVASPDTAGR